MFAKGPRLYRVRYRKGQLPAVSDAVEVANFQVLEFEKRAAPEWALEWPRA